MARFCGNCGTELEDNARVCGNCGMPLNDTKGHIKGKIPGVDYIHHEEKEKIKKKVKYIAGVVTFTVIIVFAINIVSGFVGYKGTVRKIMNAYKKYDIESLVSISSDVYFWIDDGEYVESSWADLVANDLEYFEETLGHKFKLKYNILDKYKLSNHKYEEIMEQYSYYELYDVEVIEEIVVVDIELEAKSSQDSIQMKKEIFLSKEDGEWKLLYIY